MDAGLRVAAQALQRAAHFGARKRQQPLEGKAAFEAGRDAAGDLRGLDGDGARATARVVQGAARIGATLPAGGGQHRGGQRFLQRRVALVFAPAALEERLARGVDIQRRALGAQVQHQRQIGLADVDVRALAGGFTQLIAHRVLDAQRGEVQAAQRAARGGGVHTQGVLRRDPLRPVDAAGQFIQRLLVAVLTLGHFHQHALRQAQLKVEHHHVGGFAVERHATAHGVHPHVG